MAAESVGSIYVGLKANTRSFSQEMRRARGELGGLRAEAARTSTEGARALGGFGDKVRQQGAAVKYGAAQAASGLLQFTDAAGVAGKAASGLTASLSGLLQGGLVGAGIAGFGALFNILSEQSRKAREERERAQQEAEAASKRLADKQLEDARRTGERVSDLKQAREDRDFQVQLDAMERAAQARGEHFDRQLQEELRASKQRQDRLSQDLDAELAGIREVQEALASASGERKAQLEEALRLRKANAEALRSELQLEKERPAEAKGEAGGRERARLEQEHAAARQKAADALAAEQKARSDEAVAIRRSLEQQIELARATEEYGRHAQLALTIRRAEELGLKALADRARELLAYEQKRAEYDKAKGEHDARVQQGEKLNEQLRLRERLAEAANEKEREAIQLEEEYKQLIKDGADAAQAANTIRAEAFRRAKERKEAENDVVKQLARQLELANAANDVERERIRRAHELADAMEKGGQKAVQLQQELNKLKDEAAAKEKQAAATKKREGDKGVGRAKFDEEGNFQGLGLADARQARRDATRTQKRQRAERGRMGRSIHDGRFSGLGGIRSGRRLDQRGPFSSFYGGAGDMGVHENEGGQLPPEQKPPGKDKPGGPPAGPTPPAPPGPPQTTPAAGQEGTPDFKGVVDEANRAAEAQTKALGELKEGLGKAAEKAGEGATSAADAAKGAQDLSKAAQENADASKQLAEAVGAGGKATVDALRAAAEEQKRQKEVLQKLKQDLETIQKTLSGSG